MRIPGGRDGRRMLWINFADKTGAGLWAGGTALYFVFVEGLAPGRVGLLLGVAGAFAIAGSPIAGRLADHFRLTRVLFAAQIIRALAALGLLTTHRFWHLLLLVAAGSFGERSAAALTKLHAARSAEGDRARYQALQRTVVNIGYTLGGLIASSALILGTAALFRGLLLFDSLSFCLTLPLIARCADSPLSAAIASERAVTHAAHHRLQATATPSPWRDRAFLAYVATDAFLFIDNSVFRVAMPLWITSATSAPHAMAAVIFVVNTAVTLLFQLRLSRYGSTARLAAQAFRFVGICFALGSGAMAISAMGPRCIAIPALLSAAVAYTFAEIVHATATWELSSALAPENARGSYIGVHGIAQATERSVGPFIMTSVVLTGGPVCWIGLGAGLAVAAAVQKRLALYRLDGDLPGPARNGSFAAECVTATVPCTACRSVPPVRAVRPGTTARTSVLPYPPAQLPSPKASARRQSRHIRHCDNARIK